MLTPKEKRLIREARDAIKALDRRVPKLNMKLEQAQPRRSIGTLTDDQPRRPFCNRPDTRQPQNSNYSPKSK